jgi:spore maturation protein CgeB
MKVLVLGQMYDLQTGVYLVNSFIELGHETKFIDIRHIAVNNDIPIAQEKIKEEIEKLNFNPELIVVLKGFELTDNTLDYIKDKFKDVILVNWFQDIFVGGKLIYENKEYFNTIRKYDYYFVSAKGIIDKLHQKGLTNVFTLLECCYPEVHSPQYLNNFQRKKYEQDVTFIGTLGYFGIHTNRINILKRVADEGFWLSIYGDIVCDWKYLPSILKDCHTQEKVINERHSIIAQSSLINLGMDRDSEISLSNSARMYRVMCAGGLFLDNYVKDVETMFKINNKGEAITADQELVIYYDENDLIEKLDFLLAHEDIRSSIAENGRKIVTKKHKFTDRINEMLEVITNGKESS